MTYKVHLDGYNFLPYLTGKEKKGPRKEFFYFSDGGDLLVMRVGHIKFQFMEQAAPDAFAMGTRNGVDDAYCSYIVCSKN